MTIYIYNDGNICTGSFEQSEVLQYNNTYSTPSIPGDSSYKEKKPVEPITIKEHEDTRTDGQLPMTSGSPLMKPIDIEKK